MQNLITIAVVAFIAWNERDRIAGWIAKRTPSVPGTPAAGTSAAGTTAPEPVVSRADAVDAVERLLEFARQNEGMPTLERHARDAGRSLWDCNHEEPEED